MSLLSSLVLLVVAFFVVGKEGLASPAAHEALEVPESEEATATSCRYGTSAVGNNVGYLNDMRIGWILDFQPKPATYKTLTGVEYVPNIRLSQPKDGNGGYLPTYELESPNSEAQLINMVSEYPGRIWQIGNEVDRYFWQDDLQPTIYAEAYHDLYYLIKSVDPTAQVAPSGLVEVTPGRLQYLDIVWNTYRNLYGHEMPVDVWNMHIYILPERHIDGTPSRAGIAVGTDPSLAIYESDGTSKYCSLDEFYCYAEHDDIDIFIKQVLDMRRWMKAHGYQNTPLIMTEYGILYPYLEEGESCPGCFTLYDEYGVPFSRSRVTTFMNKTLDYLETATSQEYGYPHDNYRLVQQWNWYAVNDGTVTSANNLVEDDGSGLTLMGQTYKNRITQAGFNINLHLTKVPFTSGTVVSATADVPLSVTFRNNGNTRTTGSFQVTFYKNSTLTQPIGSVTVPAGVLGCATHPYTASVTWSDLGPGAHRFWVKIDSSNSVGETDESDNIGTGLVIVNPELVYLPLLER